MVDEKPLSEHESEKETLYVAPFGMPDANYPEELQDDDEPHGVVGPGFQDRDHETCVLVRRGRAASRYIWIPIGPDEPGYDECYEILQGAD